MTPVAQTRSELSFAIPADRRLPDFFILGAPKCGTTTLFAWLESHPLTFLPNKEPNFLSPDVIDVSNEPDALTSWEGYLDQLCPEAANGFVTGEATPRYLYSDLALDTLSRFPIPPRLIVMLRNPIDLVHSLHGQMVKQGDERLIDFQDAWQRAIAREPDTWRSPEGRQDARLDYPRFGLFATRVEKVLAIFPPEQVKILILEDTLGKDPNGIYRDILRFLGLPLIKTPDLAPRNRRADVGSLVMQGHLNRLHRRVWPMLLALGFERRRGTGLLTLLSRFNRSRDEAPPRGPSPELRRELADFFADDVARLKTLLGNQITAWPDFAGEHPAQ